MRAGWAAGRDDPCLGTVVAVEHHDHDWDRRRVMVVLGGLVEEARTVIEPNLAGLTDEEYFWEPVPGSWGVRRRADIRSPDCWGLGEWVVETSFDGAAPPPMTTIGWRLLHAYDCTNDYRSRALGRGPLDWNAIEVPGTAAAAVTLMRDALRQLEIDLSTADDEVLLGASEDDLGRPRWRLLDKALLEAIHHCAEIGALRHWFRVTAGM